MKVGFLGLGNMGAAIAANVQKAGHDLAVWNRSPEKAAPLVQQGAVLARTPREAAAGREIVLTMLAGRFGARPCPLRRRRPDRGPAGRRPACLDQHDRCRHRRFGGSPPRGARPALHLDARVRQARSRGGGQTVRPRGRRRGADRPGAAGARSDRPAHLRGRRAAVVGEPRQAVRKLRHSGGDRNHGRGHGARARRAASARQSCSKC